MLVAIRDTDVGDRLYSVDRTSDKIKDFFDVPVDHQTAMPILIEYIQENIGGDVVIVSPDAGRVKLAERFVSHLNADLAIIHKRRVRNVANRVEALDVVGNVEGRVCVLVDDIIDTAGTMCAAAERLRAKGATEVHAMATHGIFSDPAIDRIKNSVISRVAVTDTLPLADDCRIDKIEVLSVAGIIADALEAVFEDLSVSEIFGGENQA